jgi:O-methyltransferase
MSTKLRAHNAEEAYLDLLKKCLLGTILSDSEEYHRLQLVRGSWKAKVYAPIGKLLALKSYYVHKRMTITPEMYENGLFWPASGLTMVGQKRLDNVHQCLKTALEDGIEGDVIETGVWRGGTTIFMKAVLKLYASEKRLFVADSFAGVPKPNPELYPADAEEERAEAFYKFDQLAVPLETVQANFRRFGLLDDRVTFLKGWFKDTLPTAPITRLALMRLDGDLYESTWDALINLYPKLQPGGFCIIDDYGGIPACKKAIHDYRDQNNISEPIVPVDTSGVYWRRSR